MVRLAPLCDRVVPLARRVALPGALACDAEVWLLFAGVPGCGGGTIAL